jgi:hypothetical protein
MSKKSKKNGTFYNFPYVISNLDNSSHSSQLPKLTVCIQKITFIEIRKVPLVSVVEIVSRDYRQQNLSFVSMSEKKA